MKKNNNNNNGNNNGNNTINSLTSFLNLEIKKKRKRRLLKDKNAFYNFYISFSYEKEVLEFITSQVNKRCMDLVKINTLGQYKQLIYTNKSGVELRLTTLNKKFQITILNYKSLVWYKEEKKKFFNSNKKYIM
jgi:hypothetical protein